MIGLSLSFCIKDIALGRVSEASVSKLVTNTAVPDDGWPVLIEQYSRTYWRDLEQPAVVALLQRLREAGKIEQPRLTDREYEHPIYRGHWIADDQPIVVIQHGDR